MLNIETIEVLSINLDTRHSKTKLHLFFLFLPVLKVSPAAMPRQHVQKVVLLQLFHTLCL